ncbi:MAG: hypothetical protein R2752_23195 [Vicinamibacterales bacterium]
MRQRPLFIVLLLAASACGGSPTSASQTPAPPASSGTSIGPAGGSVTSADGLARLDVPASALSAAVALTLQPTTSVPLDPMAVGRSSYEILPAGVQFQVPARLRIGYIPNLRPSGTAETELRLHHLAGGAWALDTAAPETDAAAHTVAGTIGASGTYAVRWPAPTDPCVKPEDRQFDFWLGEWTFSQTVPVTSSGVNSITRDPTGCLILENFNGGNGRSVSFYSRVDDQWHQTYIDTSGNRVTMAGAFDGTRMTLYSSAAGRWTWEPTDPTTIRYFGESLLSGAWTVTFDSKYVAR